MILEAAEFLMGSPPAEPDRAADETQHRVRIPRRWAISTAAVTKAQYRKFQEAVKGYDLAHQLALAAIVRTDDSPQTAMTWYEAAWYCNWLSQQEGLDRRQWCYAPNEKGEYGPGMKAQDKYLELGGYRLPTEAEWEYACRAGSVTSRYYGLSETLLRNYAWHAANGQKRTWPVASLKPNDFGLFDMHGNAYAWCDDSYRRYPADRGGVSEDVATTKVVTSDVHRVLRGGAFSIQAGLIRSANRNDNQPANRDDDYGFRPARTLP